jgi:hypothetical protein
MLRSLQGNIVEGKRCNSRHSRIVTFCVSVVIEVLRAVIKFFADFWGRMNRDGQCAKILLYLMPPRKRGLLTEQNNRRDFFVVRRSAGIHVIIVLHCMYVSTILRVAPFTISDAVLLS